MLESWHRMGLPGRLEHEQLLEIVGARTDEPRELPT
jgi:hypothetical protein